MKRRKRLQFWGEDEDDDSLVRNVIAGRKTATSAAAGEYGTPYGEYGDGGYETGDAVEVYDLKNRLRCLIRITDVQPVRFGSVPERVWKGEDFKSEQEFRDVHISCMPGYRLHDGFEFMVAHFELLEVVMEVAPKQESDPAPAPGADH